MSFKRRKSNASTELLSQEEGGASASGEQRPQEEAQARVNVQCSAPAAA